MSKAKGGQCAGSGEAMTASIRKKKTICPLDCPDSCALIATVKDNQVVSLSGDPDHPCTRGMICRKMKRYPERLNSPARLLYPQVRVGRKGAGEFRRISWDEAWQRLTEKISRTVTEFGGQSILPYCYAGNMGLVNRYAGFPLFHKLGASRLHQTI
ncbi:MAG: molybdopterin-dependent oxidoreductase, partial [Desulfocapsaceae bacterium]